MFRHSNNNKESIPLLKDCWTMLLHSNNITDSAANYCWTMFRHSNNNKESIPLLKDCWTMLLHSNNITDSAANYCWTMFRHSNNNTGIHTITKRLLDDAFAQQQYYKFHSKLLLDDVSTQQQ